MQAPISTFSNACSEPRIAVCRVNSTTHRCWLVLHVKAVGCVALCLSLLHFLNSLTLSAPLRYFADAVLALCNNKRTSPTSTHHHSITTTHIEICFPLLFSAHAASSHFAQPSFGLRSPPSPSGISSLPSAPQDDTHLYDTRSLIRRRKSTYTTAIARPPTRNIASFLTALRSSRQMIHHTTQHGDHAQ